MTTMNVKSFRFERADEPDNLLSKDAAKYTLKCTRAGNSQYLAYEHPVVLPSDTVARLSVWVRHVSGNALKVSLEGNKASSFQGTKAVFGYEEIHPHGDWHKIELTTNTRAGYPWFRMLIGHYSTTTDGTSVVEFRNPRLTFDCGLESIFPEVVEQRSLSRLWEVPELLNVADLSSKGTGTISTQGKQLLVSSPDIRGYAVATIGSKVGDQDLVCKGASLVKLSVLAKSSVVGNMSIRAQFDDGSGSPLEAITTLVPVNTELEWVTLCAPAPEDASYVRLTVGPDTNEIGGGVIEKVRVDVLGAVDTTGTTYACHLKGTAGSWEIDDDFGRFSNTGFYNMTVSSTGISLDFESSPTRPVFLCQPMTYLDGKKYFTKTDTISGGGSSRYTVKIQIFDEDAPNIVIDPSTMSDSVIIQLIGVGTL